MFGETLSKEEAYILGFVLADGCITYGNRCYKLQITLNVKDKDIIEKIHSFLGKGSICVTEQTTGYKPCTVVRYTCYDRNIVHGLMRWGIEQRKTNREQFIQLPNHLIRHFLRGFFDGDGWLHYGYSEKQTKNYHTAGFIGTLEMINSINSLLHKELGLTIKKPYQNKTSQQSYTLRYGSGKELQKLYDYLYEDSTIHLERKYNDFNAIVEGIKLKADNYHGRIY